MKSNLKKVNLLLSLFFFYGNYCNKCAAQSSNDPCIRSVCPIVLIKKVPASYQLPPTTKIKAQTYFSTFDNFLTNNSSQYDNNILAFVCNDTMYYKYERGQYSADDILPIASATKWLTASVIMTLVDENKISLSDKISKYLPIFNQYGKGDITIKQIFSHTSGLQIDTPL